MNIPKPTNQVAESDLLSLITATVSEGKQIEYKEQINLRTDDQKRKFVASITSFANASGGDLIFGIKADKGVPQAIAPLVGFDPDKEIRTLRDIIRAHIDPPLFGVEFKDIPVNGGQALLVRVPRSWSGAHMVTFNDDNRFYARDQNGRVLMNVAEVRAAFTSSETLAERVRRFRFERLAAIRGGELAIDVDLGPCYVLHLIPLRAFEPGFRANLKALLGDHAFRPMKTATGYSVTHDVDGCYAYEHIRNQRSVGYSLAFRTGALEIVFGFTGGALERRVIPNPGFETDLVQFFDDCVGWFKIMEVDPPIVVGLSLLDIKDFVLYFDPARSWHFLRRIRQRDLIIPEVLMENFDVAPATTLRPTFDAIWQACGLERSFNFDVNGEFKRQ